MIAGNLILEIDFFELFFLTAFSEALFFKLSVVNPSILAKKYYVTFSSAELVWDRIDITSERFCFPKNDAFFLAEQNVMNLPPVILETIASGIIGSRFALRFLESKTPFQI